MSMTMAGFINYEVLGNGKCTISYKSKPGQDKDWSPPSNSAVQISAAITAYARIKMYPFISRDDCYYTDTDSIVVKNPLPEEDISPTELGKFKLEKLIKKGIFLAPKAYYIFPSESDAEVIKHKGLAKSLVDKEWFEAMLLAPDHKVRRSLEKDFHRNWKELFVQCRDMQITLGLNSNKRVHIHNSDGRLVGTKPVHIGTDQLNQFSAAGQAAINAALLEQIQVLKNLGNNSSSGAHNTPNQGYIPPSDTDNPND